jgi:hypothetical protein
VVELLGPASGREDEMIDIVINGNIDSFSDRENLQIMWYVDGSLVEGDGPHIAISFSKEGPHTVEAVVIDDQGATGNDTLVLNVVNPPPIVHVDNIPTEITEGDSFTAMGYRSTDTWSDIPNLTFEWFLDGVGVPDGTGKNITLRPEKEGQRELTLRVTDDEGAFTEVNVTFKVVALSSLDMIINSIFSTFSLVLMLAFILVLFFGVYRFRKDVRSLPEPEKKEDANEENMGEEPPVDGTGNSEGQQAEEDGSPSSSVEVSSEDPDLPQELDPDDGITDPELPELEEPTELPPPPELGVVDVPGVDDSIFGEPPPD